MEHILKIHLSNQEQVNYFSKPISLLRMVLYFYIVDVSVEWKLFSFFFLLQSYNEEVAVSAQAWVDKCILAHGAPSTRMLNGIFFPACISPFSLFPFCSTYARTLNNTSEVQSVWRFPVNWMTLWLMVRVTVNMILSPVLTPFLLTNYTELDLLSLTKLLLIGILAIVFLSK